MIRDLFIKEFWLKLFSLTVAILIWLTVTKAMQMEEATAAASRNEAGLRNFIVPVAIISRSVDVHQYQASPAMVDITVHGEPGFLNGLEAGDFCATVELPPGETGRQSKRVRVAMPSGVFLKKVKPLEVEIQPPPQL